MFENYKIKSVSRRLENKIMTMLRNGIDKETILMNAEKKGWSRQMIGEMITSIETAGIPRPKLPKFERGNTVEPKTIDEGKIGINKRLDDINEQLNLIVGKDKLDKKLKSKNFKLPFGMKGKLKKLAVKSKVQVMLLQRTRNIKPTIGDIKNGMLVVGNDIYDGSVENTWLWQGKTPTMIVPEWDLKPVTPEGLYSDTIKNQRLADPQQIVIRSLEFKESLMPKKISGKMMIWILLGGAVLVGVLFMGKK